MHDIEKLFSLYIYIFYIYLSYILFTNENYKKLYEIANTEVLLLYM